MADVQVIGRDSGKNIVIRDGFQCLVSDEDLKLLQSGESETTPAEEPKAEEPKAEEPKAEEPKAEVSTPKKGK